MNDEPCVVVLDPGLLDGALRIEQKGTDFLVLYFIGQVYRTKAGKIDRANVYEIHHRWSDPGGTVHDVKGSSFSACGKPQDDRTLFEQFNLWY